MSQVTSTYESPVIAMSDISALTALSVTETDLFVTTDQKYLHKSQLTVFGEVTLAGVASSTFYYYLTYDGSNWFPVSLYNTSTGEITQRSVLVDSGTYATGGKSRFVDNVPFGAAIGFKVTGKSASGTPAMKLSVLVRDN